MDRMELVKRMNGVFRAVFDNQSIEISDAMTAKDVKGWDSLNHINLIIATERELKIKFTTKEIQNLPNVGKFLDVIEQKVNK